MSIKARVTRYDAYRLLHTEYSYLAENASQKAYEEDEVPAYKYLATLDSRTCGACGKLDGKIVKMGDGKFGVNMPPLHPLCRCTTVPHYEEIDEDVTRIARNKDDENIEVPYDMNYEEWKNQFIKAKSKNIVKQTGGKHYIPYDKNNLKDVLAAKAYRKISKDNSDIKKISHNTGFTENEIKQIKRHIFYNKHQKYDGYGMLYYLKVKLKKNII